MTISISYQRASIKKVLYKPYVDQSVIDEEECRYLVKNDLAIVTMEISSTLYSELQRQEATTIGTSISMSLQFDSDFTRWFLILFSRSIGQLGRYAWFVFRYVCPVLYWDLFLGSSNHLWGHRSLSTQTRQKHQIISFKQTFSTLLNSMLCLFIFGTPLSPIFF